MPLILGFPIRHRNCQSHEHSQYFGCYVVRRTAPAVTLDSRPYEFALDNCYSRHRLLYTFEVPAGLGAAGLRAFAMVANRKSNFRSPLGVTDLQSKPRLQTGPFGSLLVHPSEVRDKR
jgi:hypothetical protein